MNIPITPEQEQVLATEAALRNKSLAEDETPHTAESVALLLIAKSASGYAATHIDAKRRAMTPIADALIAAPQNVSDDVLAYAAKKLGL